MSTYSSRMVSEFLWNWWEFQNVLPWEDESWGGGDYVNSHGTPSWTSPLSTGCGDWSRCMSRATSKSQSVPGSTDYFWCNIPRRCFLLRMISPIISSLHLVYLFPMQPWTTTCLVCGQCLSDYLLGSFILICVLWRCCLFLLLFFLFFFLVASCKTSKHFAAGVVLRLGRTS